jgi:hypothetical protein
MKNQFIEDCRTLEIISDTPSRSQVNDKKGAKGLASSKTAVSGPEYYGLAYPEVLPEHTVLPCWQTQSRAN